ncbi:MAG: hypothetical protein WA974_16820 [Thermodesulfobacteriota bacterium]
MNKSGVAASFTDRLVKRLQIGLDWIHTWTSVIKPCRFPLIMVGAGAFFLLLVPQGEDLLRGLAERIAGTTADNYLRLFFFMSALFWTVSAWYWSRVMLFLKFPGVPPNISRFHPFRTKAPRYVGFCAAMCIAAALFRASFGYDDPNDPGRRLLLEYALGAFLGAFVFLYCVTKRRKWMAVLYKRLRSKSPRRHPIVTPFVKLLSITPSDDLEYGVSAVRDLPRRVKIFAGGTLALACCLFFLFWLAPQQTAPLIGAAAILLLAAAGWIAGGSILDFIGMRLRIPVLSSLLILAIIFSLWNDNHEVRTLPTPPPPLEKRWNVREALMAWHEHQLLRPSPNGFYPLFIVAAEGGGIRAAYWAASVLGRITDKNPCFPDQLFAISGVSGGSLGSAVFIAQLADAPVTADGFYDDREGRRPPGAKDILPNTQKILSENFLAPVVGAMLYPDLFQRFWFWPMPSFDRARTLEGAWEKAWRQTIKNDRFSEPFDNLWKNQGQKWLPALFLNSTWVETGKRLIVSNLRLRPEDFNDAEDLNNFYTKESLPLSTAVHLSARFTYVSPAGTLEKEGRIYGRAVDGGYFENSGETTVLEILQAIDVLADNDPAWKKVTPVVIHISNQPVDPRHKNIRLATKDKDKASSPGLFLSEALSPVTTMLNTRNARAVYARETVMWHVGQENFLHFGLSKNKMGFPLGWVLSDAVQRQLDNQLGNNTAAFDNLNNLTQIGSLLKNRYDGASSK